MVKKLDGNREKPLDHIGFDLWLAAQSWRRRLRSGMAARGFPWHETAAGELLAHLGPSGRSQAALTEAMGMSKQAVQQLLDLLEAQDVVRRVPDPADRRARRIELTELGLRDYAEQKRLKGEIEDDYRKLLGDKTFKKLRKSLKLLSGRAES